MIGIVAGRQQEDAGLALPGLLVDDEGADHRPVGGVDAARKRPAAGDTVAAGHAPRPAARKDQRRADQIVGRFAPDLILRLGMPHAQEPMMRGKVGQHPGGRATAAADHRRQLEQCAVGQFAAAHPRRLQHAEQAARMQIGDRLVGQPAQFLGPPGALAQYRHQRLGAGQQLFEARRRRALSACRLGHCDPLPHEPLCALYSPPGYGASSIQNMGWRQDDTAPPIAMLRPGVTAIDLVRDIAGVSKPRAERTEEADPRRKIG